MTPSLRLWLPGLLAMLSALAMAAPDTPAMAAVDDARCQVWARELSFAQSVTEHDPAAFSAHLHADAVFGAGSHPTRGREAIRTQWTGIIDGSAMELSWYPDRVSVGGDGRIAYSSGPALYRNPKDGSYRLGRFGSVWQQGGDGLWRVVFDEGIARPAVTDDAGAKAFQAGRRTDCPPV